MGDRKRKLGSREAFTVPRVGEGFQSLPANEMYQSPIKATGNIPDSGKGYMATPDKSYSASLSNDELAEMYSNCIKLSTENVHCDHLLILMSYYYYRKLPKKTLGN
jgi:hypothetical protein